MDTILQVNYIWNLIDKDRQIFQKKRKKERKKGHKCFALITLKTSIEKKFDVAYYNVMPVTLCDRSFDRPLFYWNKSQEVLEKDKAYVKQGRKRKK